MVWFKVAEVARFFAVALFGSLVGFSLFVLASAWSERVLPSGTGTASTGDESLGTLVCLPLLTLFMGGLAVLAGIFLALAVYIPPKLRSYLGSGPSALDESLADRIELPRARWTWIALAVVWVGGSLLLVPFFLGGPFVAIGFCLLPLFLPAFLLSVALPALAWYAYLGNAYTGPSRARATPVLAAFAWGMASPFIVGLTHPLGPPLVALVPGPYAKIVDAAVFTPFVEELAKVLGFLALARWVRNEYQGLLLGAMMGAGFAVLENALYLANLSWPVTVPLRVWGLSGHLIGPALVGASIGWGRRTGSDPTAPVFGSYLIGVLFHGLWNGLLTYMEMPHGPWYGEVAIFALGYTILLLCPLAEILILRAALKAAVSRTRAQDCARPLWTRGVALRAEPRAAVPDEPARRGPRPSEGAPV